MNDVITNGLNGIAKAGTALYNQLPAMPLALSNPPGDNDFHIGNTTISAPLAYSLIGLTSFTVLIGIPCASYLIYRRCTKPDVAEYDFSAKLPSESNLLGDGEDTSMVLTDTSESTPLTKKKKDEPGFNEEPGTSTSTVENDNLWEDITVTPIKKSKQNGNV